MVVWTSRNIIFRCQKLSSSPRAQRDTHGQARLNLARKGLIWRILLRLATELLGQYHRFGKSFWQFFSTNLDLKIYVKLRQNIRRPLGKNGELIRRERFIAVGEAYGNARKWEQARQCPIGNGVEINSFDWRPIHYCRSSSSREMET